MLPPACRRRSPPLSTRSARPSTPATPRTGQRHTQVAHVASGLHHHVAAAKGADALAVGVKGAEPGRTGAGAHLVEPGAKEPLGTRGADDVLPRRQRQLATVCRELRRPGRLARQRHATRHRAAGHVDHTLLRRAAWRGQHDAAGRRHVYAAGRGSHQLVIGQAQVAPPRAVSSGLAAARSAPATRR